MGAAAYRILTDFFDAGEIINILEIGSEKIDAGEGSTKFFTSYVQLNSASSFNSIDLNESMVNYNNQYKVLHNLKRVSYHSNDYKVVIPTLDMKFNFVYLDNFDYLPPGCEYHDWCIEQQEKYINNYGIEMTNENSSAIHLEQTNFLHSYVADKTIILFDDTFLIEKCKTHEYGFRIGKEEYGMNYPMSGWYGKGSTAVPWLIDHGWSLIDTYPISERDDWTALKNF